MMKMNIKTFGILALLAVLIVGVVLISGCGGASEKPETPTERPVTQPIEETTTPPSDESLSDVLAKAVGIGSVKYDMVITIPGEPSVTSTVWMKGHNMRTEMTVEGQTMIMIMNGDKQEAYTYFPDENMATKIDFSQATESATEKSATEEVGSIEAYNPTGIGTETIDGKLCTVVEYASPEGKAKMWIWLEHGFPIRTEITTPEGTGRTDWRNIEFVDIPDNMFELPAGVEIMEIPAGIPGMPGDV